MSIEEVGFLFILILLFLMFYLAYLFISGMSGLNRIGCETDREMYPDCEYPLDDEEYES